MSTSDTRNKRSTPTLLLLTALGLGISGGGCAYGGMTATPDGKVLIARNSMLGGLRKIYVCTVADTTLSCVEAKNAP